MKRFIVLLSILIFGSFFLFAPKAFAVGITIRTDPAQAKVGETVKVYVDITDAPANASQIQLYISDSGGSEPSYKTGWAPPSAGASAGYQYEWVTTGSDTSARTINVLLLDKDNFILSNQTASYTLAAAGSESPKAGTSPANTSPDPKSSSATTTKDHPAGKIGPVTFLKTNITSVKDLIVKLIYFFMGVVGTWATIAIIYSGIMYTTAGGDTTKVEAAKKNLLWAITGLIIAICASLIVYTFTRIVSGTEPIPTPTATLYTQPPTPNDTPYTNPQ